MEISRANYEIFFMDFLDGKLTEEEVVRLGYRFIKLFANYSMVSMFQTNLGPEVYPVTIGLTLINFR